eukprot:scaffold13643_cov110-Isochrysis_galbana.AAC.4
MGPLHHQSRPVPAPHLSLRLSLRRAERWAAEAPRLACSHAGGVAASLTPLRGGGRLGVVVRLGLAAGWRRRQLGLGGGHGRRQAWTDGQLAWSRGVLVGPPWRGPLERVVNSAHGLAGQRC